MNRAQRRAKEKAARQANKRKESGLPYQEEPGTWFATSYKTPKEDPPEPQVPGVNCRPVDPEFTAKVERNSWHDREEFDQFVNIIKTLSQEEKWEADGNTLKPGCENWTWSRNWKCKYVNLRIDMRDGGFVFTDDDGNRINLEQLRWQYKSLKGHNEGIS